MLVGTALWTIRIFLIYHFFLSSASIFIICVLRILLDQYNMAIRFDLEASILPAAKGMASTQTPRRPGPQGSTDQFRGSASFQGTLVPTAAFPAHGRRKVYSGAQRRKHRRNYDE